MKEDCGFLNEKWTKLIIDQLVSQGVHYFCLSPGSRSTPLALSIASHPKAKSMVHFDERGMAFHALGVAKASKRPVAIVVTSGTAVGNLMPAVMEANLAQIPLLLLTSDRPPELRAAGANQTADQVKIFGDQVRWEFDLPPPDAQLPDAFLASTISHAVYRCKNPPKGPVHINCMFREPFFSSQKAEYRSLPVTQYELLEKTPSISTIQNWAEKLSEAEKGVIIVGSLDSTRSLEPIFALGKKLQWPIISDIISGLRSEGEQEAHIAYSDLLLKTAPPGKPEIVLHLGDRIVSKTLAEWLFSSNPATYCQVTDHPFRQDPKHQVTNRMECDPVLFCEKILPEVSSCSSWLSVWKEASLEIGKKIEEFFASESELTEPEVVRSVLKHIPQDWGLFLSNSMPIRDADNFFFPKDKRGPIFSNRGLSGIDGNIATAIGLAEGGGQPIVAILGDLAALHDINSLAMAQKRLTPVLFLVINNQGGGIFSFLPVREKKEIFDEYFAAKHSLSFEMAARMFGLEYFHPASSDQWDQLLPALVQKRTSCVIEITTQREENYAFHQKIQRFLKEPICCLISKVAH